MKTNKERDWSYKYVRTKSRSTLKIQNSVENPDFMKLLEVNYQVLRDKCIKSDIDEDYFSDTILQMTIKWSPELDFIDQFHHQFCIVKLQSSLDSKATLGMYQYIDDENNHTQIIDEVEEQKEPNYNNVFSKEDIKELIEYADNKQRKKTS